MPSSTSVPNTDCAMPPAFSLSWLGRDVKKCGVSAVMPRDTRKNRTRPSTTTARIAPSVQRRSMTALTNLRQVTPGVPCDTAVTAILSSLQVLSCIPHQQARKHVDDDRHNKEHEADLNQR